MFTLTTLIYAVAILAIIYIFTSWIREKTRKIEGSSVFFTYASPQFVIFGGSLIFGYNMIETLYMIGAMTMGSGLFYSFLEESPLR